MILPWLRVPFVVLTDCPQQVLTAALTLAIHDPV